jgi:branched-chain amino acid aminotransferase
MEIIETIPVQKTKDSAALTKLILKTSISASMYQTICLPAIIKMATGKSRRSFPFQNISLSPTTLALHYGQSIFEGMKAFRMEDGSVNIFRIEKHFERLNKSLERMCMPLVPL